MAEKWVIVVGGYGAFLFEGTEAEAEEMRLHKARWERGVGKKRPAEPFEIESGEVSHCWNRPGFRNRSVYVDCPCDDMSCAERDPTPKEPK